MFGKIALNKKLSGLQEADRQVGKPSVVQEVHMTNLTQETKAAFPPLIPAAVNREYKSTVFSLLYRNRRRLLSLYNAMNNSHYTNSDELIIVTLENAIYMAMKNDNAFVLDHRLNLYEHQSTPNPNLPLSNLFYVSREYEKMVARESLYASKKIKIPAPHFVVFYNGTVAQPERQVLKLSDLYEVSEDNPKLELEVEFLNINSGFNQQLKEDCKSLKEYMLFVDRVCDYADREGVSLSEAVERAVTECIREGILADFLEANRREVVAMSIFEYDAEYEMRKYRQAEREVALEEGHREGMEQGMKQGIEQGREQGKLTGLEVLITLLKKYLPDFEAVYKEVTSSEPYKNCTREQIREYYIKSH